MQWYLQDRIQEHSINNQMPDRQNGSIPRAVLCDPGFVVAWFVQSSVYVPPGFIAPGQAEFCL